VKGLSALVDKELRTLFQAPIAWIVIGVFLGLTGYSFTLTLFNNRYATLAHIFFQVAGLLLLIVPIITMRLLAEERRAGTLELLLTAPVQESHVVLAKYLAGMAVVLIMIGLTAPRRPRSRPRSATTGSPSATPGRAMWFGGGVRPMPTATTGN